MDLIAAHLTGDGLPRAVDSRTMLSRWEQAIAAEGRELSEAEAVQLAGRIGAGRVLLGDIVLTSSTITMNGRVLNVPRGESSRGGRKAPAAARSTSSCC